MNTYDEEILSTNTYNDTSKKINDKRIRLKLLQIPFDSLNKTIPSTQHIEKDSSVGTSLSRVNSHYSENVDHVQHAQQKLNQLIQTGDWPYYMTSGDFNNDGSLDLATTSNFDGDISALLNSRNGTFQYYVRFVIAAGLYLICIASDDFNKDGKLDVAICNEFLKSIQIAFGTGNGAFAYVLQYSMNNSSTFISPGNFNNDGYLDLAVTIESSRTIVVLLNNKNGTFRVQRTHNIIRQPFALTTSNFINDGKLDLAITDTSISRNDMINYVTVLVGNGDGTFQIETLFKTGGRP
ncbi:unnamed protein product [Rotaria socialis]|uniref:VCBS repeat-containing protein n=1 Tax=Rotaria socialis TaxID=392032 RepID=A0A818MW85_9BILA|nr:unnamed protein product [Rotaria socialis]CAF4697506.1 unnamed protein product [Rotaria socialis]